eukprot:1417988-Pleurochrysis_carterae.AAC.2
MMLSYALMVCVDRVVVFGGRVRGLGIAASTFTSHQTMAAWMAWNLICNTFKEHVAHVKYEAARKLTEWVP